MDPELPILKQVHIEGQQFVWKVEIPESLIIKHGGSPKIVVVDNGTNPITYAHSFHIQVSWPDHNELQYKNPLDHSTAKLLHEQMALQQKKAAAQEALLQYLQKQGTVIPPWSKPPWPSGSPSLGPEFDPEPEPPMKDEDLLF